MRKPKKLLILALALLPLGVAVIIILLLGRSLMRPHPTRIGQAPDAFPMEDIALASKSGATLRGWFKRAESSKGAVLLLHGIRGSRLGMLERARLLHTHGYSVMLIDLRAHGESTGDKITFGWLESRDVHAAISWLEKKCPGERLGVIGASLGGAAALLADPPLPVHALVLELVYRDIKAATANRLKLRFGSWASVLTPLLTFQLPLHLGISSRQLQPVEAVSKISAAKLFLAGGRDRHTTPEESESLFAAAATPKQFVLFETAAHQDLYAADPGLYEEKVVTFLKEHLR